MKRTSTKAITLILITTLLTAGGQIFFKLASKTIAPTITGFLLNYFMWIGFILYGSGFLLLILGLKEGELSTLYPMISLSYVWVLLLSFAVFGEIITWIQATGFLLIILGVGIMGANRK